MKITAYVLIIASLVLSACGESSTAKAEREAYERAQAQQAADVAAAQAEEARRIAIQRECVGRAATGFNDSLNKTFSDSHSALMSVSLENCPTAILSRYSAYATRISGVRDAYQALAQNQSGQEDACKAGAVLTVLEMLVGESSGLTPCSDSLNQNATLKENYQSALSNFRAAESELRIEFANNGFVQKELGASDDDAMSDSAADPMAASDEMKK